MHDTTDEYLGTGPYIHGDDEESVEVGEDIPVHKEYGGMKPEDELSENVADDERDDEIDTGDDHVAPTLAEWELVKKREHHTSYHVERAAREAVKHNRA